MIYEILGFALLAIISIFSLKKIDWKKRVSGKYRKIPRNYFVLIFIIIGIILSIIGLISSNIQYNKHDLKSDNITILSEQNIYETKTTKETILNDYQEKFNKITDNFKNQFDSIILTILNNTDSALTNKMKYLKKSYKQIELDYNFYKEYDKQAYITENWPASVGLDSANVIVQTLLFPTKCFIITGEERYIIYELIKLGGKTDSHFIEKIHVELRKLNGFSDGSLSFFRLVNFGIIKYNSKSVEFEDKYMERLKVYKESKNYKEFQKNIMSNPQYWNE